MDDLRFGIRVTYHGDEARIGVERLAQASEQLEDATEDAARGADRMGRETRDAARGMGLNPCPDGEGIKTYVERTYGVELAAEPDPPDPDPPTPDPDPELSEGGGGPVEALAEQARRAIGPLADAWAARLRRAADGAASLEALRDWLDADAVAAIDPAPVADALAEALAAAHLAGRRDVGEAPAPADLAEPSMEHLMLPFREQIDFFRRKLSLPTRAWTDIWQSQHDTAFVVAGAARTQLVADLREAVDAAIADGETLESFRRRFDAIVERRGWSYMGGRDWRTRVIYETNLATSYAAGRWSQLQEVRESRPYWRYRHSPASAEPRADHLAWDGLVLRADDPWWQTHFPPNGWGCKCYIDALDADDLEALGKTGPDQAPPLKEREARVGSGPSARTAMVPEGIDPGFAHAPGRSALGEAAQRAQRAAAGLPPEIAAAGIAEILRGSPAALNALRDDWAAWRRETGGLPKDDFAIGALQMPVLQALRRRDIQLQTAAITVTRREAGHAQRPSKQGRLAALDAADMDDLPVGLAQPRAVLLDTRADAGDALIIVWEPQREGSSAKAVVRLDFRRHVIRPGKPRRRVENANALRTTGYVSLRALRDPRYELLWGELD